MTSESSSVPSHVFREYDVRGLVGEELSAELLERLGRAYGAALRERLQGDAGDPARPSGGAPPRIVLGHDNRPSSPELADAVASGLVSAGLEVVEVGTAPTPAVYWAEYELGADGALQVTGSHNPPEYNGVKMTIGGESLHGDAIRGLRDRIERGAGTTADRAAPGQVPGGARGADGAEPAPGSAPDSAPDPTLEGVVDPSQALRSADRTPLGRRSRMHVLDRYVADLASRTSLARTVRVVVDCGNGVGSLVATELLRAVGVEAIPLFCESDGTFPNHHPDPTVDENLEELIAAVRREGAELGIAFDGDADRIGIVDDTGAIVRGDVLLLLLGLDLLRRRGPGQKLVFDVKCSQLLPEVYGEAGGVPIMWKTGHSLMKEKMRVEGAPLAGELSGHIFFGEDYYGFDDALLAACRISEVVSRSDRPLSQVIGDLPRYVSTPEIRLEVGEERKFELVRDAVEHFRREHDVIDVDGARILFDGGWALLRASNTQPAVVARLEAEDEATLDRIRGIIGGWLGAHGVRFDG